MSYRSLSLLFLSAAAWAQQPVTLDLKPLRTGGRTGTVSIKLAPEGLSISGDVKGGPAKFAATPAEMGTSDHVEIWIAPPTSPELPAIGWGNQFGMENEKSEKDCAELGGEPKEVRECQAWFRRQPAYRVQFRKLFVRQYQVAPDVSVETFARAAWDDIQKKYTRIETSPLKPLLPSGTVTFRVRNTADGYAFEALLPWTAFPPMPSLRIDRLKVMVDVFSASAAGAASQPYSSTSPARKYGDVATMNQISAPVPRLYKITRCEYPLKASDAYFDDHPAWFFPTAADVLNEIFILQNFAAGYQYTPAGLSPGVRLEKFSQREVEKGEFVCGPDLALNRNGRIAMFDARMDDPDFQVRRMPDGALLVKEGPVAAAHSEFGSGQCGSCPHVMLDMHRITADGKYELALEIDETVDGGDLSDADVQVTPDWSKVTVFRQSGGEGKNPKWSSETFCLTGTQYKSCASKKTVPAPGVRSVDPSK